MKREVPIEDLQRLYSRTDMVKADCRGCEGCSQCCSGMGESVILDPYDCYCLERGLSVKFTELLQEAAELNVSDGLVLPNLNMNGKEQNCYFLTQKGRCRVHEFRPGICRLFPLGRYYQEGTFQYFLQSRECPLENKTKVKISKWLGIPELKQYEDYIVKWHYLLEEAGELIEKRKDAQLQKDLSSYLLELFYVSEYRMEGEFYSQFEERYLKMKKLLAILGR